MFTEDWEPPTEIRRPPHDDKYRTGTLLSYLSQNILTATMSVWAPEIRAACYVTVANLKTNDALFLAVFCSSHSHYFLAHQVDHKSYQSSSPKKPAKTHSLSSWSCFSRSCGLHGGQLIVGIHKRMHRPGAGVSYRWVCLCGSSIGSLGGLLSWCQQLQYEPTIS